jgi:hypothetical protein
LWKGFLWEGFLNAPSLQNAFIFFFLLLAVRQVLQKCTDCHVCHEIFLKVDFYQPTSLWPGVNPV